MPTNCFEFKRLLTSFVFPDVLKKIREFAFHESGLSGSLNIPEGVTDIKRGAFENITTLNGTLSLPSTLKRITGVNTFLNTRFVCELKLPDGLEEIGEQCFMGCTGFYGELKLPSRLQKLGVVFVVPRGVCLAGEHPRLHRAVGKHVVDGVVHRACRVVSLKAAEGEVVVPGQHRELSVLLVKIVVVNHRAGVAVANFSSLLRIVYLPAIFPPPCL